LWNGLYVIPLNFLFLKSRTELIAIGTVKAGFVNVAINFLFIQDYGIMATAWATLVVFFVMLISVFLFSNRIYSFPNEYRRIAGILSSAGILILV
jgi:O-antigen/teichoic acid export membrane protein